MELDSRDGKLRVFYGERLVVLLNEVRQLSSLGYDIPSKIMKCADVGKKFYQYGVELQAVESFLFCSIEKNFKIYSYVF